MHFIIEPRVFTGGACGLIVQIVDLMDPIVDKVCLKIRLYW